MERSQEQWKLTVPQEFWQPAHPRPKCFTVGDLKEQLARLPDDLRIGVGGSVGTSLTAYSLDTMDEEDCDPRLLLEDVFNNDDDDDDWDEDDETWMDSDDDDDDDEDFWDDGDDWEDDEDDWDSDSDDEDEEDW